MTQALRITGWTAFAALASAFALLWLPSPARAEAVSESRTVAPFDAIASGGGWDLVVHAGTPATVRITAEPAVAAQIETIVDGSTLKIRPREREWNRPHGAARIEVTLPQLRALHVAGAGDTRVDPMKSPRLAVTLAGAGDFHLDRLDADEFELRLSGSGNASAVGAAQRFAVSISGSGDVAADDFTAAEVTVRIAGSGNAAVQATRTLAATIAGSGRVVYSGHPAVQQRVSGSGTVSAR